MARRKRYSAEFKRQALRRANEPGMTDALGYRQPQGTLLHHSDRGPQYTSDDFRDVLEQHGIECSMSARGHCYDNAPLESFFSLLKRERVKRQTYKSREEAKADIFDYIERF